MSILSEISIFLTAHPFFLIFFFFRSSQDRIILSGHSHGTIFQSLYRIFRKNISHPFMSSEYSCCQAGGTPNDTTSQLNINMDCNHIQCCRQNTEDFMCHYNLQASTFIRLNSALVAQPGRASDL